MKNKLLQKLRDLIGNKRSESSRSLPHETPREARYRELYRECLKEIIEDPGHQAGIMAYDRLHALERQEEWDAQEKITGKLEAKGMVWTPSMLVRESQQYWLAFNRESDKQAGLEAASTPDSAKVVNGPDLDFD